MIIFCLMSVVFVLLLYFIFSIVLDFLIILKNRKYCNRFREELPKECKSKCYTNCLYCKYSGRWYRERNYK